MKLSFTCCFHLCVVFVFVCDYAYQFNLFILLTTTSHSLLFTPLFSIALTQVRQQRALEAASESAGTDQSLLSPEAIPGILLHAAMLNLFSDLLVSV